MRVTVLTLDQRDSRLHGDTVPTLVDLLDSPALPQPPLRPFQRTAGDELQGVVDDAGTAVEVVARVLRGGAWIGSFERAGVFAALIAGWPEGIAVVLALKGLGRYSELKSDSGTTGAQAGPQTGPATGAPTGGGVAERFIIGTFCSVLWAVACAGVVVGLLP